MKINIEKDKSSRLINCGMVIMVSCGYQDKRTITPCAWHMPVSKEPAIISVALAKKHFSSELIRKSKEFIINIPDWKLLDKMMKCGKISGRNIDKFDHASLTAQKAKVLDSASLVQECIANIECQLIDIAEKGDHYVFYGEIANAIAEQDFFINDMWDTKRVDLIFHLGGKFFFKSNSPITF